MALLIYWTFFILGLTSLTGQIVLLREILGIFYGTEISIGMFLGTWLAEIGAGASVGALLVKRLDIDFRPIFLHSLVALGCSLILQIFIIRFIPAIFRVSPAELAPLHGILLAVPVGTFSTAFITGFLFPIGCKAVQGSEAGFIARIYSFEALGSLVGGLVLTFVLLPILIPVQIAASMALLLASAAILNRSWLKLKGQLIGPCAVLFIGALLLSPAGVRISDWSAEFRWETLHPGLKLVASRSTRYQQVEVGVLGKQFSLFGNGKIITSFPDPHTAGRLSALIVAQNPQGRKFLLIGSGISFLHALLQYPVERVDVIEPDPGALETASRYFSQSETQALNDPRVRMIFSDGRFYVNRLGANEYDAVVCIIPDPVSSFWNRYYTLEFFQSVFRSLTPAGFLVTSVTSAENFWGAEIASYAGSIYHTLKQVFPVVQGTPGDTTLFFASVATGVISLDPEALKLRYSSLPETFFDPEAFATILPKERTKSVAKELERSPALLNTDFAPISSSLAMILWGRFSGSDWIGILNTIRQEGLIVFLIPIVCFLLARISFRARWGPRSGMETRFQALLALFAVGAGAMGMQIVLIYTYQSLFGYVFERIGLLAGFFMAGLAGGSYTVGRLLTRIQAKDRTLVVILIIFSAFCLLLTPALQLLAGSAPWLIETIICLLVLFSGVLTGIPFPLAASRHLASAHNTGETSGWTDAADHYGAAAGAILAAGILFPLFGAERACIVLAIILITPAILILCEILFTRADHILANYRPGVRASFPYIRVSWFLFFIVAAAMAWRLIIGIPGAAPVVRFSDDELKKISGSESFTFVDKPYPHYIGKSAAEPGFTVTLSTLPIAGEVRGYGGPINLLLSVSNAGIIRGVKLVQSKETPSYIKGIDNWLAGLNGRPLLSPPGTHVDTMTGATISAQAIINIIQKSGNRIAAPLLALPAPESATLETSWNLFDEIKDPRLWAVIFTVIFFLFAFYSGSRRVRMAGLAASLLVLGFWLNAPFTCLDVVALLNGDIPARGILWRNLLFVAVIGISVFWGQAFCGFLCPFGALQELISVRQLRRRASYQLERVARYAKFVILALLLSLALVTNDTVWFYFSPLQHFFRLTMDYWIWTLALVCLAASVVYFRFWCRYLCPAGAFLAIFNKINLFRKWAPRPIPSRCDLGVSFPDDLDCIRCLRCRFRDNDNITRRGNS
jgi:predicted membrane-bound spermidine synthase